MDRASAEAAWTPQTSAVMLATPSNPTGTSIPFEELASICALARERSAWRIVDEIYLGLADPDDDGTPAHSVLETDPEAIVINSFSKYFGMTGWRLGWAILPEELVQPAENLAVNYFLCASTPIQQAALAVFSPESISVCEDRRQELLARRSIVLDGLQRIGLPVPVLPDGAFYVYFDVSSTGLDAQTFCHRALEEAHVALTPGQDFATMMTTTMMTTSTTAAPTMIHSHGTPKSPALSLPTAWRLPFSSRTSFQVTILPFFSALPEASVTFPGKVIEMLTSISP